MIMHLQQCAKSIIKLTFHVFRERYIIDLYVVCALNY